MTRSGAARGGIRDLDTIEKYIDGGLRYVIIGTAAVKNPGFLKDAHRVRRHIIVGLDAKDGKVATDAGASSPATRWSTSPASSRTGRIESIIYTDIAADGMLSGSTSTPPSAGPRAAHPRDRSGGLSNMTDTEALCRGNEGHRRR